VSSVTDSPRAWLRLAITLILSTLGGAGMWSSVVFLPAIQSDFGITRGAASLPYTFTMIGFGIGGIFLGRLADRRGIVIPLVGGSTAMAAGFVAATFSTNLWQYALVQGLLVGVGSSASFAPLIADISFWFVRRRALAVAVCASGSYLAGAVWPPIIQHFIQQVGWRHTSLGIGLLCAVIMLPLAMVLRARSPGRHVISTSTGTSGSLPPAAAIGATAGRPGVTSIGSRHAAPLIAPRPLGLSTGTLQTLLNIAGLACCTAMSMPQVHMVAYCGDLGYGPARGAQMLSVMLGCGIFSRLGFGIICDRIGGLRTLMLGSCLQCFALLLFLPFDSLVSLFLVCGLFGLFQGGIVPSYAIIVREYFPPEEAGARVGMTITATLFGMALGGWLTGVVFDATASYKAAFVNGILWNLLNMSIAGWLLARSIATKQAPA
jgi:MFS family permease